MTFSYEGLNLWLGSEFAENSYRVLQILAVGVLINSLASVPYGLVQSAGRPDLTAKLHVVELPFYLLILWWLLNTYGIIGVAIAWSLRVTVDAIILSVMANSLLEQPFVNKLRTLLVTGGVTLPLIFSAILTSVIVKSLFLLVVLSVFAFVSWFIILSTQEKCIIRDRL